MNNKPRSARRKKFRAAGNANKENQGFESLFAAIGAEDGFNKPWAELSDHVRTMLETRLSDVAGADFPPLAVAIVGIVEKGPYLHGNWQYRREGKSDPLEGTWVDVPVSALDKFNALILTMPKLRFNPERLHPDAKDGQSGSRGSRYGPSTTLIARRWKGFGPPPAPGTMIISSADNPLQWTADTVGIYAKEDGNVEFDRLLKTVGFLWDRLDCKQRESLVQTRDEADNPAFRENPAIRQDRELVFELSSEIEGAEMEPDPPTYNERITKKDNLAKQRAELTSAMERVDAFMSRGGTVTLDEPAKAVDVAPRSPTYSPPVTYAKDKVPDEFNAWALEQSDAKTVITVDLAEDAMRGKRPPSGRRPGGLLVHGVGLSRDTIRAWVETLPADRVAKQGVPPSRARVD